MQIIFSNDRMEVTVRPDLGGRIDRITDRQTGKDWLWHPAGYGGERRKLDIGACFDDNWTGGWDDIFPSDAACQFRGLSLPDHGELWSQPWRVVALMQSAVVLSYACRTVPVTVEKTVAMAETGIDVRYLFENHSSLTLPFLFKLHPALAIEPGDRILLPDCSIEPVDMGFSSIIGRPGKTPFPLALDKDGREVRIDRIPGPDAQQQEFVYARGLSEAWCGVSNARTQRSFVIRFEAEQMPYVWVFGSYGKWRGHYVLMPEPCTNVPYDLETAFKNGTCGVLPAAGRYEIVVSMQLETTALIERSRESSTCGFPAVCRSESFLSASLR